MILSSIHLPFLSFAEALALDVTSALATHALYKHYEPEGVLPVHFVLLVALPAVISTTFGPHFISSPWKGTSLAFFVFYASLLSSIVIYRLSPWHPLARYPGPTLAKLTKFWGAFHLAGGKFNLTLKELHEKHGPYVRVGPNEISVTDVDVFPGVLTSFAKGPMWRVRIPDVSGTKPLIALQTAHEHTRRRKPWSRAFNTTSIKGYEPIVQKRALQLVSSLKKLSVEKEVFDTDRVTVDHGALNFAGWLSYFTTDFMGDMAFGGGFELMRDGGDKEGIWTMIEEGFHLIAFTQNLPWLEKLLRKLALGQHRRLAFGRFALDRVRMRVANGSVSKDLFYHLMDEGGVEKVKPTMNEVLSDGGLAIIAGSDTTSTVLSGLFFHLLCQRNIYERLQKEVDAVFPAEDGEPFDAHKLEKDMPYLNAVINEALRLQPPVPTQLQRAPEAGSGGKWIKDHYFSENTAVIVPPYAIQRDPKYFSPAPNTFWPDRWLPSPSLSTLPAGTPVGTKEPIITNPSAFIPFSYGPANCAGKGLALMEMRMMVALLMQQFEMRFADGYDVKEWDEHLEDLFVLGNGKLPVVLASRQ